MLGDELGLSRDGREDFEIGIDQRHLLHRDDRRDPRGIQGCCPQWPAFARHRVERAEAAEDLRPPALGVALGDRDAAGPRQSDRLLAEPCPIAASLRVARRARDPAGISGADGTSSLR